MVDKRGKNIPSQKITEEKLTEVENHIKSFPAYESHYTRRDSSQKYLHANLNLSKMYRLYTESHENAVSMTKYSDIFKTMGIKFKSPKIDTCHKCDVFKTKLSFASEEEKQLLNEQRDSHHLEADKAYEAKKKDKAAAEINKNLKVYTFDLEKCLPTPYLNTSVTFYKRQLWTFNLTIHDSTTGKPYCYMWNESQAKRGGNEIAACLYKHLKQLPQDVQHIIFYSDNCVGQNKNAMVAVMFMMFATSSNSVEQIEHKFLESGHTHMECDVDHSVIERQKKRTDFKIEIPRDWSQFIRGVRSNKPFEVIDMMQDDFLNFSYANKQKFIWRKVDEDGNKFIWNNVKWLKYTKGFGYIQYKNSLDDNLPFYTLNIRKRGVNSFEIQQLPKCYNEAIKISDAKKSDLIDLLPLIDPMFHSFYRNLPSESMLNFHPDLTEADSENEAEN